MNCPYCTEIHSDDTKYCPKTGKKIIAKSCQNHQCKGYNITLPNDAKFCPICGGNLDFAVGESKERDVENKKPLANLAMPIISNFFPLNGVYLGVTTIEEIDRSKYKVEKTYEEKEYITEINGVLFFTQDCTDTRITRAYISAIKDFQFKEWDKLGFNKEMSFDDFRRYFKELGFIVTVERKPMIYMGTQDNYFSAGLKAVASDESMAFVLRFEGNGKTTPSTVCTLENIRIFTNPSMRIEGSICGQILRIWN